MRVRKRLRRGMASLDAVMTTGVVIVLATFFLLNGIRLCKWFYHTVATLVCWPYI